MEREYEIFECLRDGSVKWRSSASDLRKTKLQVDALMKNGAGTYFALHLPTGDLLFSEDMAKVDGERATRRVFQIAYTDEWRSQRAEILKSLGYGVISIIGNEAAKEFLKTVQDNFHLFIIENAASIEVRKEMFEWLKSAYPTAIVVALNRPNEELPNADYNARNDPESWLPFVKQALSEIRPD